MQKFGGLPYDIIDTHAHAFPDAVAKRALQALTEGTAMPAPTTNGTIAELTASMDVAGIRIAFIANIATRPTQSSAILEWSESIRSSRILPLGAIHPRSKDWEFELTSIARAGIPGIKLHPLYQDFAVDGAEVLELYAMAARLKLFVLLHAGYDLAFPGDDRASPKRIAQVKAAVPELTIIAAHLGGWNAWDEASEYLCGKDIYLDTSFMQDASAFQVSRILQSHGSERILFGSDAPWQSQHDSLAHVRRQFSSSRALEQVLSTNAIQLLRDSNGRGSGLPQS